MNAVVRRHAAEFNPLNWDRDDWLAFVVTVSALGALSAGVATTTGLAMTAVFLFVILDGGVIEA